MTRITPYNPLIPFSPSGGAGDTPARAGRDDERIR